MRVITGEARGRKLKEPQGMDIRPTTELVKEAMFSIIQFDIEGRRVLDLFGGTGQLGIEAASRGAREVVIVDESARAMKNIRENVESCKLEQVNTVLAESLGYLRRGERFDIVIIDPPYDTDLAEKALEAICRFDILSNGGIIICETRTKKEMPQVELPYFLRKAYTYGQVKLTVYEKET